MNCEKAMDLISVEADAALTASERTELEEHLTGCPSCRRYRDALRMIDEGVCEPVEPPETLLLDVMSELRLRETEKKRGSRRHGTSRWGALAACAVLVAGAALLGLRPGGFLRSEVAMSTASVSASARRMSTEAAGESVMLDTAPAEAAPAAKRAPAPRPATEEEACEAENLMLPHDPESFAADCAREYLESELGLTAEEVSDWDAPAVELCGDDCRVTFIGSDGGEVTVVMNGSGELLEILN